MVYVQRWEEFEAAVRALYLAKQVSVQQFIETPT